MTERPVDQLSLRELCTNTERLCRELIEHLEQGVLPQAVQLDKLTAPASEADDTPDVRIRNQIAALLSRHDFTQQLCRKMDKYLEAMAAQNSSS